MNTLKPLLRIPNDCATTGLRIILVLLALSGTALAELGPEARLELGRAREAAARARASYSAHHSDQNLWQEAIHHGNRALALAPDAPEVHRFLAETYTTTRWQARAWASWTRYAELVSRLDLAALRQLGEVGHGLAAGRAQAGDAAGAAEVYRHIIRVSPGDLDALTGLARHHLARGEPEAALPYWQELSRLQPEDEAASHQVAVITDGLRYGAAAATAYYGGRRAAAEGRPLEALAAFEAAAAANPLYTAASIGAARANQELGRLEAAERLWRRVLALEPGDEETAGETAAEAAEALELLAEGRLWGVRAVTLLRSGLLAEAEGWVPEASGYFQHAAAANPRYKDAFVHLARNHERLGEPMRAYLAWRQVLRLDPRDPEAPGALAALERQALYGAVPGRAFYQGLERSLAGDHGTAAEHFGVETVLHPRSEAAWAYLARSRFALGDYRAARRAFEAARALNPAEASYPYYLREIGRRLEENAP